MPKIDAHQHFWKFNPERDTWITDEMAILRQDFLPQDLQPVLERNGFDGCVVVQSDETNAFLLASAEQHNFIKGVVGWIEFQDESVGEKLEYYSQFAKMKGFRYILQGQTDKALMLKPEFKRGIKQLAAHGYTYDILIYPDQLIHTRELVASFPDQPFVIDHLAKPYIKQKKLEEWKKDIKALAAYNNVYCKISGMVTEADWTNWKKEEFIPYIDAIVEAFGTKRIMYGSDWPVCLVAAEYEEALGIVENYFATFTKDEQDSFFGGNAAAFYNL